MTHVSNHTYALRVTEELLHRTIDGETFITKLDAPPGETASFVLNQIGTLIWELADGQHTIAQIAQAISTQCDIVPDTALQDTLELVKGLVERKLVVVGEKRFS